MHVCIAYDCAAPLQAPGSVRSLCCLSDWQRSAAVPSLQNACGFITCCILLVTLTRAADCRLAWWCEDKACTGCTVDSKAHDWVCCHCRVTYHAICTLPAGRQLAYQTRPSQASAMRRTDTCMAACSAWLMLEAIHDMIVDLAPQHLC